MPQAKKPLLTFKEKLLFYTALIGGLCGVVSALPPVSWRYARADPTLGMRFSADRRYSLFSASNHFSQDLSYMKYRTKMCGKMREFASMSPVAAIGTVVSSEMQAGGAAVGCPSWKACIDHTAARCTGYGTIAASGIFAFCAILVGSLSGFASATLLHQEPPPGKSQKKRALLEEARTKTAWACGASFVGVGVGTGTFNFMFVSTLDNFRNTGYYPWPDATFGTWAACASCLLLGLNAFCGISRIYQWGSSANEDEDQRQLNEDAYDYQGQPGMPGVGPGYDIGMGAAVPWS